MTPTEIALLISSSCFVLGLVFSCVVLYAPALGPWRIQRGARPSLVLFEHMPLILLNFLTIEIGVAVGFRFLMGGLVVQNDRGVVFVALQFLVVYLIDDFFQYWLHRYMHQHKAFFRRVHRVHHEARQPMPLDYLYVHPIENAVGSLGVFLTLLVMRGIELDTFYVWIVAKNVHLAVLHSGLRTPFAIFPFLSRNEHHERHHSGPGFNLNYAQNFTHLDKIFGTDGSVARDPQRVTAS